MECYEIGVKPRIFELQNRSFISNIHRKTSGLWRPQCVHYPWKPLLKPAGN